MSIQIVGVLDGLEIQRKKASGWIRVTNDNLENKASPLITVSIGKKIIAQGLATTSRPDIKLTENSMAFGFSLNLTDDINELKKLSDFQVIAEYKNNKANLIIYQPIALALQYFLLNSAQRSNFIGRIITDFEQASLFQVQLPSVLAAAARTNPPTRKLCVLTYLNDTGAWFPYFYKYYSSLVGDTAIYVVTPKPSAFDAYKLGGIISCSDMEYDDQARSQLMSGLATGLQAYYEWTLVCDPDEIVVPHPNAQATFFELLNKESNDVIISRGFDIIQMDNEPDFSVDEPVLTQRHFAIPNMAICKPHLARKPIQYSVGYHYCNYKLDFSSVDDGFLTLHLKSACRHIRKQLSSIVLETTYAEQKSFEYASNSVSDEKYDNRLKHYLNKPIETINSLAMQEFEKNYTKNLMFGPHSGIWRGEHICATFLVKLS
jgi:hypothetical protein